MCLHRAFFPTLSLSDFILILIGQTRLFTAEDLYILRRLPAPHSCAHSSESILCFFTFFSSSSFLVLFTLRHLSTSEYPQSFCCSLSSFKSNRRNFAYANHCLPSLLLILVVPYTHHCLSLSFLPSL